KQAAERPWLNSHMPRFQCLVGQACSEERERNREWRCHRYTNNALKRDPDDQCSGQKHAAHRNGQAFTRTARLAVTIQPGGNEHHEKRKSEEQYSAVSAEHRDGKPAKCRTCRRSSEDANNRAAPLGTRENAGRKALAPRFGVLSFIETRDNREQEEKE